MTTIWVSNGNFPPSTVDSRPQYFRSLCFHILKIDRPDDHALQDTSMLPFFAIPLPHWGCWLHLHANSPYQILRWADPNGILTLYGGPHHPKVIDNQGDTGVLLQLMGYGDSCYWVIVRDPAKPVPVLLRVAPTVRVREAVAWTFTMRELDYQPVMET